MLLESYKICKSDLCVVALLKKTCVNIFCFAIYINKSLSALVLVPHNPHINHSNQIENWSNYNDLIESNPFQSNHIDPETHLIMGNVKEMR